MTEDSPGGPWSFCGLLPLFDPPRHDSSDTIHRALNLGVCVKMITGKFSSMILQSIDIIYSLTCPMKSYHPLCGL